MIYIAVVGNSIVPSFVVLLQFIAVFYNIIIVISKSKSRNCSKVRYANFAVIY